jgi:hypothetical protein
MGSMSILNVGENIIVFGCIRNVMKGFAMKLIIELKEGGRVDVTGPLKEKLMCYGLLEMAKDAIREFSDKQGEVVNENPQARSR